MVRILRPFSPDSSEETELQLTLMRGATESNMGNGLTVSNRTGAPGATFRTNIAKDANPLGPPTDELHVVEWPTQLNFVSTPVATVSFNHDDTSDPH